MKRRGALVLVCVACAPPLAAQGVRVTGSSVANYVELRPVAPDSIRDSLATGVGLVRESAVGLVSCPEGQTYCYFYRSLARSHTLPVTQDLEITGWGFGEGVSAYAHVRARANAGGVSQLWTRADDRFNALAAYVEVDRDRWRARAGRQWLTSQLGVNNFDGVSALLRSTGGLRVEGYAGASLIRGLSETGTGGALAATDVLPPDVGGLVFGAAARWRTTSALALGAEYQREIRRDRAGVYAERVALDGAFILGEASLVAQLEADVSTTTLNEVRVRATRPVRAGVTAGVEARHSTPFFPLWTIWGVFSPVGFNEARADVHWRASANDLSASLAGGYRRYQNTHTGVGFLPLRDDGWTVIASGTWRPRPSWNVMGSYRRDIGFGAAKSDAIAGAQWHRGSGSVGITGSAVQNIFEFRLASGYVVGAAVDASLPVTPDVRLSTQAGLYRQIAANTPSTTVNWSQRRAFVRLEWAIGSDPGSRPVPPAAP